MLLGPDKRPVVLVESLRSVSIEIDGYTDASLSWALDLASEVVELSPTYVRDYLPPEVALGRGYTTRVTFSCRSLPIKTLDARVMILRDLVQQGVNEVWGEEDE